MKTVSNVSTWIASRCAPSIVSTRVKTCSSSIPTNASIAGPASPSARARPSLPRKICPRTKIASSRSIPSISNCATAPTYGPSGSRNTPPISRKRAKPIHRNRIRSRDAIGRSGFSTLDDSRSNPLFLLLQ